MQEIATVLKTEDNTATVKVDKKDECSKCGMCFFPKNANYLEFTAENSVNARIGDEVLIEKNENGKLLGAVLVFLVPLLLIGVGAVLGLFVFNKELLVLAISVFLIIVWFVILGIIDKKLKNSGRYGVKIIKVLTKENPND